MVSINDLKIINMSLESFCHGRAEYLAISTMLVFISRLMTQSDGHTLLGNGDGLVSVE